MSLHLKAFPPGRPTSPLRLAPARLLRPALALPVVPAVVPAVVLAVVLALALSLLPGTTGTASAVTGRPTAATLAGTPADTAGPAALTSRAAQGCAAKKRRAARKACRAAVRAAARAREAQVRAARALAITTARAARARAASMAASAVAARAAAAGLSRKQCAARKRERVRRACLRSMLQRREAASRATTEAKVATVEAERTRQQAVLAVGRPPAARAVVPGSYFSYPNGSSRAQQAIRTRVLDLIRSTWGGPRDGALAWPGNGTIRIATWTFSDWQVAKALVAAHRRGVSVQVVAARAPNREHPSWTWLRHRLGGALGVPSVPGSAELVSFARECRGSCRGPGGTPHAKYLLFDVVGPTQARDVVVQTSMNLTRMGWEGQWNQAQVLHSAPVHQDFLSVFRQARNGQPLTVPYHAAALGNVVNYFFPRPGAGPGDDPVMQVLSGVRCVVPRPGATPRRTSVRIIQYAMYGDRGVWIARRLRALWKAGCDIRIIYSVSSRPVMQLLRDRRGRGPIPTRQSVLTDRWGWVTGYNHSKWMTVTGGWGSNPDDSLTLSGSANWSDAAFSNDEQMTLVRDPGTARAHLATFDRTWQQRSTRRPGHEVRWNLRIQ